MSRPFADDSVERATFSNILLTLDSGTTPVHITTYPSDTSVAAGNRFSLAVEGTSTAQAARRGTESLTIAGSLDYQACDDTVDFTPVSVPRTWTMSLKAVLTERPPPRHPYIPASAGARRRW